jgi:hypothetical protein
MKSKTRLRRIDMHFSLYSLIDNLWDEVYRQVDGAMREKYHRSMVRSIDETSIAGHINTYFKVRITK